MSGVLDQNRSILVFLDQFLDSRIGVWVRAQEIVGGLSRKGGGGQSLSVTSAEYKKQNWGQNWTILVLILTESTDSCADSARIDL